MTDYATLFNARRNLIKAAYTEPASKPHHRPSENPAVNVMVDTILLCKSAGVTIDGLIEQAQKIADAEWYFAEAAIREAVKS